MVSINNNLNGVSSKLPKMVVGAFKGAGFSNNQTSIKENITNSGGVTFDLSEKALAYIAGDEGIDTLGTLAKANNQEQQVQKFTSFYI